MMKKTTKPTCKISLNMISMVFLEFKMASAHFMVYLVRRPNFGSSRIATHRPNEVINSSKQSSFYQGI